MTIQSKSTIIVLATFILGVVVGMLSAGLMIRPEFKPREVFRRESAFMNLHEKLIEPGESQRDTIRVILEKYYEKFSELNSKHRGTVISLLDSLHTEIYPLLTEEQKERLAKKREYWDRMPYMRGGFKRPGPSRMLHDGPLPQRGQDNHPPPMHEFFE